MKKQSLILQAIAKLLMGMVIIGVLVFVSAGSVHYWQGWIFMSTLFVPMLFAGAVLAIKNPTLLQKRLYAKEREKEQQAVVKWSGLLFVVAFVVAGLNWRWQWWILPEWVTWVSVVVFIGSYALYGEVLCENMYLSRTIEVQEEQRVIDSGVYSIVRHPMYTATIFLFLSMPLILGSLISFLLMLVYLPLIVVRIKHEEELLTEELCGYKEYRQRVRYKLFPGIW